MGTPAKISMNAKSWLIRNALRPVSTHRVLTTALATLATCWNQMVIPAKCLVRFCKDCFVLCGLLATGIERGGLEGGELKWERHSLAWCILCFQTPRASLDGLQCPLSTWLHVHDSARHNSFCNGWWPLGWLFHTCFVLKWLAGLRLVNLYLKPQCCLKARLSLLGSKWKAVDYSLGFVFGLFLKLVFWLEGWRWWSWVLYFIK